MLVHFGAEPKENPSFAISRTHSSAPQVLYGDLSDVPLEQLSAIAQEVYLPLLSNPRNQDGWPEVVTKEVLENLHKFIANVYVTIGQTKGKTLLPLPPAEGAEAGDKAMRDKDRIHVLESAVVTWTRQIKNVLKIEPDEVCHQAPPSLQPCAQSPFCALLSPACLWAAIPCPRPAPLRS